MSVCLRCRIDGRVQGVWFRGSTRQRAEQLGLSGSATNMPDGSVEVIACGEEKALADLEEWLWQGPPHAVVERVECERIEAMVKTGFTTA